MLSSLVVFKVKKIRTVALTVLKGRANKENAKNTRPGGARILVCAKDRQFGSAVTGGKCTCDVPFLAATNRHWAGAAVGKGKAQQRLKAQHAEQSLSGRGVLFRELFNIQVLQSRKEWSDGGVAGLNHVVDDREPRQKR